MRLLKVFLLFGFLLCLMEPCLVEPIHGVFGEGLRREIRLKRGVEEKAERPNTREKRSHFSMLEKRRPPMG